MRKEDNMSKFCPVLQCKVTYLSCSEYEDKPCRKNNNTKREKEKKNLQSTLGDTYLFTNK